MIGTERIGTMLRRFLAGLLCFVLGFVSCIASIVGVGWFAYSKLSIESLEKAGLVQVDKDAIREDLKTLLPIVRSLAEEFADVYIPLDEIFEEAVKNQPEPKYYSGDGVHPNTNGSMFIGAEYAKAVKSLIEGL